MHSNFMRDNYNRVDYATFAFDGRARLRIFQQRLLMGNKGLTQAHIDQLGTIRFKAKNTSGAKEQCAVCFQEFQTGMNLRLLPCGHEYHQLCIDVWLGSNCTCPTCRANIPELIGKKINKV
jgi:hypothetical protein